MTLVLAAAFGLADCSPVSVLNGLTPNTGLIERSGLPYANAPRHELDLYQPRGYSALASVVVFFYGGSWRNRERADYRFTPSRPLSRGC